MLAVRMVVGSTPSSILSGSEEADDGGVAACEVAFGLDAAFEQLDSELWASRRNRGFALDDSVLLEDIVSWEARSFGWVKGLRSSLGREGGTSFSIELNEASH